jgi:hypothetical protein
LALEIASRIENARTIDLTCSLPFFKLSVITPTSTKIS